MPSHTQLKGVTKLGESLLSDHLERNLRDFYQWGFLGIGGFNNLESAPTSGIYGGNKNRLRLVDDPNYEEGQVWEAFRQNWVWETGVSFADQPVNVSGVYVDGTFYDSSTVGAFSHYLDYPNGRVVFNTAIPTTSVVTCNYSYRSVNFLMADVPWWREFQKNSYRVDSPHFLQEGSGAWSILSENRVQLPTVIVEAVPRTDRYAKEIGSTVAVTRQDVLCHILSETRWEFQAIHDVLTGQWDKTIIGYDVNEVRSAEKFPLDANGSRVTGALMYPDLVSTYAWKRIRIQESQSFDYTRPGSLYYSVVRNVLEVDTP